jgi:hypothetical protein
MNGDDDMSCSNTEEVRNVTDKCEEDEGTECEDKDTLITVKLERETDL